MYLEASALWYLMTVLIRVFDRGHTAASFLANCSALVSISSASNAVVHLTKVSQAQAS